MAIRIQRKRIKDYTQPLGTIYVGRPTKWGNPFKLTYDGWIMYKSTNRTILDPWIYWSAMGTWTIEDIIELYEMWLNGKLKFRKDLPTPPNPKELKGANLSCWCSLDEPCHVDVLLKYANQ